MKIWEYLKKENIYTNFPCDNKHDFLEKAVEKIVHSNPGFNFKTVLNKFLEREETMTTGIGKGIAVPHIIYETESELQLFAFKLSSEIDFNSLDKKPVNFAIIIVGNNKKSNMLHLQTLAKIARSMKNNDFIHDLTSAMSADEIYNIFKKYE